MRRARWLCLMVVFCVGAVSCGGGSSPTKHTAARATTTTSTVPLPPVAPLTGLPDPQNVARGRSALWVKIENTPEARPQTGLDAADVVYEEVVEYGITRFWALFNSGAPDQVGPIRSVRAMDPNVVSSVGGVVAYSGGAQSNVDLIRAAPVTWVDENNADNGMRQPSCEVNATATFCRSSKKAAPHNLFGRTAALWQRGGKPVPPPALFTYLRPGQAFTGDPVTQFHLNFQHGYDVTYQWDATSNAWKRFQQIVPLMSSTGTQIAPNNVVVLFVPYTGDGEGQLIGQGDAWVFANGQVVRGHWAKATPTQATTYTDIKGAPLALPPGHTWVELYPAFTTVDITPPPTAPAPTAPAPTPTTTRH